MMNRCYSCGSCRR